MIISQSWKRNDPTTYTGESITLTIIYSSFDKKEIDEFEKKLPKGIMMMSSEPTLERSYIHEENL